MREGTSLQGASAQGTLQTTVCIVGAGAAGGILAHELTARNVDVLVLDAGPRFSLDEKAELLEARLAAGCPPGDNPYPPREPAVDRFTTGGEIRLPLGFTRNKAVGGTTLSWLGNCPRLIPADFEMRSRFGVADDWPFDYDHLEPYYARAEWSMGIAGADDNVHAGPRSRPYPMPPIPLSYSDKLLVKAADEVGMEVHHTPQARNSVPWQGRSACLSCGTCAICPAQARLSIDEVHIPAAEATGRCRVIADASVLRLEEDAGRVTAVVFAGLDRREKRVEAEIVVLAAGGIETPRVLLLSRNPRHPEGLANESGQVGRNFHNHPIVNVAGKLREQLYPYRIDFESAESFALYDRDDRDRVGAALFNFNNSAGMGETPYETALRTELWGERLAHEIQREFGHWASITAGFDQLPNPLCYLELDPDVTDHYGLPVPKVTYNLTEYDRRTIASVRADVERLLRAADARQIFQNPQLWYAGHHLGATRTGTDPAMSVVNPDLVCHEVENLYLVSSSVFVTGGAANPTLTIAALAIRAADHIVGRLS